MSTGRASPVVVIVYILSRLIGVASELSHARPVKVIGVTADPHRYTYQDKGAESLRVLCHQDSCRPHSRPMATCQQNENPPRWDGARFESGLGLPRRQGASMLAVSAQLTSWVISPPLYRSTMRGGGARGWGLYDSMLDDVWKGHCLTLHLARATSCSQHSQKPVSLTSTCALHGCHRWDDMTRSFRFWTTGNLGCSGQNLHNLPMLQRQPGTTKNVWSAFKDPLALNVLSQNVIIWIVPFTFSQVQLLNLASCQCPVVRNMVSEHHNIASRMILKVVSEGSYGSNLIHMDVGSAERLAQHGLHITASF
eukprot:1144824-Pelagomonas_calceolata.AAC.2